MTNLEVKPKSLKKKLALLLPVAVLKIMFKKRLNNKLCDDVSLLHCIDCCLNNASFQWLWLLKLIPSWTVAHSTSVKPKLAALGTGDALKELALSIPLWLAAPIFSNQYSGSSVALLKASINAFIFPLFNSGDAAVISHHVFETFPC